MNFGKFNETTLGFMEKDEKFYGGLQKASSLV